jgi:hypothetical protein
MPFYGFAASDIICIFALADVIFGQIVMALIKGSRFAEAGNVQADLRFPFSRERSS